MINFRRRTRLSLLYTCKGNALNVVAQLLDALAEVDTKFVKIADKECDEASNDVKKWFKKLAVCFTVVLC